MLETFGHVPVSDPVAIANGAVPLREEESQNITAGFVVNLGGVFRLTADYFRIDIDDRITLVRGSVDNVTFFSNLADTETDGFDINAQGTIDAGAGTIGWLVAYNRSETKVKNPSVLGEEEINTLESAAPDDKIILSGNWALDRWRFMLRATRFGETTRDFDFGGGFPDAQIYSANWGVDLEVAFNPDDQWTLAIGADNVFDEYPDASSSDINYFGHWPTTCWRRSA